MVELRHLGGALGRAPQDAGALGSLDGKYAFFALGIPMDPAVGAAIEAHLALTRAALAPYESGSACLNFAERPVDTATMFDTDAYRRLRQVKAAFDPGDLVCSNHPIPAV